VKPRKFEPKMLAFYLFFTKYPNNVNRCDMKEKRKILRFLKISNNFVSIC
jgi:hypothetical protein